LHVRAREDDQFPAQGIELLLRGARFQHPPAYSCHRPLEHGSNQLGIGRQRLAGGRQHEDDRLIGPYSHLLHDPRSVHIGAYRVESDTRLRVLHLGVKECGDEGGHHLLECFTLLFLADQFHGIGDLGEMTFQCSL